MNSPLKSWLVETGTTQRRLALDVGARDATVSGWVRGITPSPKYMKRIAEVTGGGVPIAAWFESSERVAAE